MPALSQRQAELGQLGLAQRQLLGQEELVELRRHDARAREHGVVDDPDWLAKRC